jgi:hypothetical protein
MTSRADHRTRAAKVLVVAFVATTLASLTADAGSSIAKDAHVD